MKGFSPIMLVAGLGVMIVGLLLAGPISDYMGAMGPGGDLLSMFFPIFPFIVGLFVFVLAFYRSD